MGAQGSFQVPQNKLQPYSIITTFHRLIFLQIFPFFKKSNNYSMGGTQLSFTWIRPTEINELSYSLSRKEFKIILVCFHFEVASYHQLPSEMHLTFMEIFECEMPKLKNFHTSLHLFNLCVAFTKSRETE